MTRERNNCEEKRIIFKRYLSGKFCLSVWDREAMFRQILLLFQHLKSGCWFFSLLVELLPEPSSSFGLKPLSNIAFYQLPAEAGGLAGNCNSINYKNPGAGLQSGC